MLTGPGSCGAFLMLENGVPIRPVGFCNVNEMFEINTEQADSVEVLRGPSNSLYGSSAVHGAVNVLQAAPADRSKLRGGVDAGPDQYRRIKLAARARRPHVGGRGRALCARRRLARKLGIRRGEAERNARNLRAGCAAARRFRRHRPRPAASSPAKTRTATRHLARQIPDGI